MSCDFDFYCADCGSDCGFYDLNWGGDQLLALLQYRSVLEGPEGMFDGPDMNWWLDDAGRLGKAYNFFSFHRGHRVIVLSEYGHPYSGGCRQGNTSDGFCFLGKGHDGEHQFPKKFQWNETTQRREEVP